MLFSNRSKPYCSLSCHPQFLLHFSRKLTEIADSFNFRSQLVALSLPSSEPSCWWQTGIVSLATNITGSHFSRCHGKELLIRSAHVIQLADEADFPECCEWRTCLVPLLATPCSVLCSPRYGGFTQNPATAYEPASGQQQSSHMLRWQYSAEFTRFRTATDT